MKHYIGDVIGDDVPICTELQIKLNLSFNICFNISPLGVLSVHSTCRGSQLSCYDDQYNTLFVFILCILCILKDFPCNINGFSDLYDN